MHIVSFVSQFVARWDNFFCGWKIRGIFHVVIWGYSDADSMHFVQIFIFMWFLHCTAVASYFRANVIWLSLCIFFRICIILWITCYMRSSRHTRVSTLFFHNQNAFLCAFLFDFRLLFCCCCCVCFLSLPLNGREIDFSLLEFFFIFIFSFFFVKWVCLHPSLICECRVREKMSW